MRTEEKKKETGIERDKTKMERAYGRKEGARETEINKDGVGERAGDREATGAEMTWIHRSSIDYLRMKKLKKELCFECR